VGLGVRHALFPDSLAFGAQLWSSTVAGCQFPDAASFCTDLQIVSGPTAEPTARRFTYGVGLLSEASQPGLLARPSTGCLLTRPESGCERPFPAVFRRDRLMPPGWWLRRGPHVTGLASLLSSCVSLAGGRRCFQHPPHSDFIVQATFSRLPAGLGWLDSLRDGWLHLRAPVAKPGPLDGFSMVRYRQEQPTTLTHSSNCRPWADCVRLHRWKPHPWDVTRFAVGFGEGRTFGSCCPAPPLAARLPFRITVLVRPSPGEPVTYASRGIRP